MNSEDYFEGIRTVTVDLERTLGRIKRCDDQLELHGVRYDGDGGFSSTGERDAMSAGVVELMQYREYLKTIQGYYISLEKEADFVIMSVRDPKKRRALGLRYMENLTFGEIGERIGYSDEWARRLCELALEELDHVLVPLLQEYRQCEQLA